MTKGAAWAFPVERAGVRVGSTGAMDPERIRVDSYDSQRSTEGGCSAWIDGGRDSDDSPAGPSGMVAASGGGVVGCSGMVNHG